VVRYRRNRIEGATYFFTLTLADRQSDQLTANITHLREAFRTVRDARRFDIDAIVILPDHLHAILTLPEGDADFSTRWRLIKTIFTKRVVDEGTNFRSRDTTGRDLWQRRFWEHTIRNDDDFARHVDYIHYNPVKHGLVHSPGDWPHSSLRRFVRKGIFAMDWGASGSEGDDFGERVE
jgi:putative transposase